MESPRRPQRVREANDRTDDNLESIELKIPSFQGRNDLDAYLECEDKIELVFDHQNYSEIKNVQVCDYAISGII